MDEIDIDLTNKVKFYLRLNRFEAAEKLLKSKLSTKESAAAYMLLGIIYHQQSRFDEAIEEFSRALKIDPMHQESRLHLIITMCDIGRYEEARQYHSTDMDGSSHPVEGRFDHIAKQHYKNGEQYEHKNKYAEALSEYRKSVLLTKKYYQAEFAIAKILYKSKQYEQAGIEFEKIVKRFPLEPRAHIWLGISYQRAGRVEEAKLHWEKARENGRNTKIADIYWDITQSKQVGV